MDSFEEYSWSGEQSSAAQACFGAIRDFLEPGNTDFEMYLVNDLTSRRLVLRVLVGDPSGDAKEQLKQRVEAASSTHEYLGSVPVRYEITEAAGTHIGEHRLADPSGGPVVESHRWWHRW